MGFPITPEKSEFLRHYFTVMTFRFAWVVLLALVLPFGCFNFNNPVDPEAEDYQGHRSDPPPDTQFRREITITQNPLGSTLSDYQVAVPLNTATMGSPYQNVNSDGSDLRFTNEWGTQLSYWIESWDDSGESLIWVRILSIPTGASTIYMYYGNPSAVSVSNGEATFLFFDDFQDHAAGEFADGWTGAYQVVDDGGIKALDDGTAGGQAVVADHAAYTDVAVRQRFRSLSGNISYAGLIVRYTDDSNMICAGPQTSSVATILERKDSPTFSQLGSDLDITPALDTAYHVQELAVWEEKLTSIITIKLWIDDNPMGLPVLTTGAAGGRTGFWSQDGGERSYRDWHLVRKYVLLEPTVSAIGPEETL